MPTLTRWYLKSALAWLALAGLAGAALTLRPLLGRPPVLAALQPVLAALQPVQVHMWMVGWVTQLIFGIAHWLFPKPEPASALRGERLGWLTWLALNAGLALRVVGEPLVAGRPGAAAGGLVALSAVLQPLAAWLFVAAIWPRVRAR